MLHSPWPKLNRVEFCSRVQFDDSKVKDISCLEVRILTRNIFYKPHDIADGSPGPKAKKPQRPPQPKTTTGLPDPVAIRTIVISALPSTVDSNSLWKKVRKLDGAEMISQWPGKTSAGEDDPSTAHVLFSTPATAQNAVLRLHAHVFKSSRSSRLIVRNLPWTVRAAISRINLLNHLLNR